MKLYFSNLSNIISTVLILGFGVFFCIVYAKRGNISHWGLLVACLFFLGLLMSIMSGMKDNISTATALIPAGSWLMTVLSVLGALGFVIAIAALIFRKQNVWQFEFYLLSAVILLKTVMVELYRILQLLHA